MALKLKPIDLVENITKEEFEEKYLKPRIPVVLKGNAKNWPAYEKWSLDYMKKVVGDIEVPLYDSSKADPAAPINASVAKMKFADYIELIRNTPTDLRIFLFDPIKKAPKLLKDYVFPKDLMGGFLDKYPTMFFGGKGSVTFLHYDIDMAHIFHTHFNGRKHILLFDYKWKERLYQIPFATYALEDYDISNPDFDKFPALDGIEGIECYLEHGDTLFMPTGMWHWMKYLDGSFSLSLRAWDQSISRKLQSVWSLFSHGAVDSLLKMAFKVKYAKWREKLAVTIAEKEYRNNRPR